MKRDLLFLPQFIVVGFTFSSRDVWFLIAVFTNLLQLIMGRPAIEPDPNFVLEVKVRSKPERDPKLERFILVCWVLIAVKHVFIIYACAHWPVPFHQLWLNAPTFALGLLATVVYWVRR